MGICQRQWQIMSIPLMHILLQKCTVMYTNKPVSEIMSKQLVTVVPETPLSRIIDLFAERDFHHLPVVESGQQIVGIISKDDIRQYTQELVKVTTGKTWTNLEMKAITAAGIMTKSPICLDADDSIGLAADIFLANQFHALPVLDDGELVGIVTTHDLLAYVFQSTLTAL